jgi:tRNA (cytidine/uridine-2'-O-)-methyltransferase
MFDIVLFQPEIPPNTGNLIRLAATGCGCTWSNRQLALSDKQARAGDSTTWPACGARRLGGGVIGSAGRRRFALHHGSRNYATVNFQAGDVLLFGPNHAACHRHPGAVRRGHRLRLPMLPGSRSMNLSNAVSVVVFEAWRQNGFAGGG